MNIVRAKNLWRFLLTALLLSIGLLDGCSFAPSDDSGGTGSEIVGKTEYLDSTGAQKIAVLPRLTLLNGLPVIGGRIFVYPRAFIPDTSWATRGALPKAFTDTAGFFRVQDVPHGVVFIEATDGNGKGIVKTITVDQDSTTYDAGVFTLKNSGAVSIQAHTSLPGSVRFYVSVAGTRCVVRGTLADVDIVLSDIPAGIAHTINIRVYQPIKLEKNFTNINVPLGGTFALPAFDIQ